MENFTTACSVPRLHEKRNIVFEYLNERKMQKSDFKNKDPTKRAPRDKVKG